MPKPVEAAVERQNDGYASRARGFPGVCLELIETGVDNSSLIRSAKKSCVSLDVVDGVKIRSLSRVAKFKM
jgi:hypothetical protein